MGGLVLLAEADHAGLNVRADGDRLVIRGSRDCEALARRLLDHKTEIMRVLTATGPLPEWADGVRRLIASSCPDGESPERWRTLQADAMRFVETWGVQAAKLGWETVDVFGVNVTKSFVRLDAAGLIRLLDGRPVAALTEYQAVIQCRGDSRLAFRRKAPGTVPAVEQCLLWQLPATESRDDG